MHWKLNTMLYTLTLGDLNKSGHKVFKITAMLQKPRKIPEKALILFENHSCTTLSLLETVGVVTVMTTGASTTWSCWNHSLLMYVGVPSDLSFAKYPYGAVIAAVPL